MYLMFNVNCRSGADLDELEMQFCKLHLQTYPKGLWLSGIYINRHDGLLN